MIRVRCKMAEYTNGSTASEWYRNLQPHLSMKKSEPLPSPKLSLVSTLLKYSISAKSHSVESLSSRAILNRHQNLLKKNIRRRMLFPSTTIKKICLLKVLKKVVMKLNRPPTLRVHPAQSETSRIQLS